MPKPDGPQFAFIVHSGNAWPYDESTGDYVEDTSHEEFNRLHPHVRSAIKGLSASDVDVEFDVTAAVHRPSGRLAGTLVTGAFDQPGEVNMIETSPEFRRQGIATQLLGHAQRSGIPVKDDFRGNKTDEGRAFADGLIKKGVISPKDLTS